MSDYNLVVAHVYNKRELPNGFDFEDYEEINGEKVIIAGKYIWDCEVLVDHTLNGINFLTHEYDNYDIRYTIDPNKYRGKLFVTVFHNGGTDWTEEFENAVKEGRFS